MASTSSKGSSSNEGFFQDTPIIPNQFPEDVSLQRVVKLFLPQDVANKISPDLYKLGKEVLSKEILDLVTDAEKNVPYLRGGGRDAFGRRTSELVVTEGWKRLQNYGIEQGIVASGYEESLSGHNRVAQFLKLHLWTGSCANVACPSAMTDGAAKLLRTHLSSSTLDSSTGHVFQNAYNRLTSRDPTFAWTSGQWMTERTGGSDVSKTETIATYSPDEIANSGTALGSWRIDGFKWFSSATDSSMAILLAQTPKGLSTFYAPMYRSTSGNSRESKQELNGIFISRLKNKFGTKSLPTAELELSGMRAYLIGKEGQGIQEISTILNISRLYSAVSAVGYLGRGIAIAKAFSKVREVGAGRGKRIMLKDNPLHISTLARVTGEYHAMMLFTFFTAWLMGMSEDESGPTNLHDGKSGFQFGPESSSDIPLLLRVLTPILKASVCKGSIHALQECMEALGGVGYLDNTENEAINISRIYRDCCVLSIWEGTTDVLASDMLRVLKGRNGTDVMNALDRWILRTLEGKGQDLTLQAELQITTNSWITIRDHITTSSAENLLPSARRILFKVANVIMATLIITDAKHDMDTAAIGMASAFLQQNLGAQVNIESTSIGIELNQRIVFGMSDASASPLNSKL